MSANDTELISDIEWAQRCVDEARKELEKAEELLAALKSLALNNDDRPVGVSGGIV